MQEKQETQVQSLGREDPLEEEMENHSNILAWRIPRTEESGRLQSMEPQSWTQLSAHPHSPSWVAHRLENAYIAEVLPQE